MSGFKGEPVKKINPYVSVHWIKSSMFIKDNMCVSKVDWRSQQSDRRLDNNVILILTVNRTI